MKKPILWILAVLLISVPLAAQPADLPNDGPGNDKTFEEQELEDAHIRDRAEQGDSHASGMRPELGPVILGNPTSARTLIRVGLSYSYNFATPPAYNEFNTRHHPFVTLTHTAGDLHLLDVATGKQIMAIEPATPVHVTRDSAGYHVTVAGALLGTYDGPIFFRPTDAANLFRIESIRRSPTFGPTPAVPVYRGTIELSHGSGTEANRLHVVNIVELEDYVPGVVANESIASFHMEALKAQAVAARGYAIANLGRFRATFPYDIVDSTTSQVYRGVISEHPRAIQASNETIGLVASHTGQIISALYSSSMGGHTENNEWIFPFPSSQLPGANATAYTRGIYDGDGVPPDFSSASGVSGFWATTSMPSSYDDCGRSGNTFSRWRFVMTHAQLRAKIPASIPGTITNVEIIQRMTASGRAAVVRISLSSGRTFDVRGWDPLRAFFRPVTSTPRLCGTGTIAANFTLNNPSVINVTKSADGTTVSSITVWGGGWGHNVGMSQYGANGRGRAGQNFMQILKAYYTGVDIGSYPIDIGREPGSGPPTLRQTFYAPNAAGELFIRRATMRKLRVHINGTYDLSFDEEELADGSASADISAYLVPGLNTIQYNPVGHGSATVTAVVE